MTMLGLEANMGRVDRLLRVAIGIALLALGFAGTLPGLWGTAATLFGWWPLLTGLSGWCPFYSLVGIRTCRR
jgi:hypothetical protein